MAEQEFTTKEGGKSALWNYFGLKRGVDGKGIDDGNCYCFTCRGRVTAKNGNTSNLLAHLKSHHPKLHAEAKEAIAASKSSQVQLRPMSGGSSVPVQPTIEETMAKAQKYERRGKKWKDLTDAITFCIANDNLPIHVVAKPGFIALLNKFDPRYELPSESFFSKSAIPALYSSTKDRVMAELGTITYFSATTDLWSSAGMRPYMSYTVHFVNDKWEMQSRCLQTHYFPENHTGQNIADAMEATLDSWNLLASNQVCLTTDSGSNMISAARILKWPRLSCFGHNLHLAVTKAFNDDTRCSRALGICRKIVSCFSMSFNRRRNLTKAQINLGIDQRSLISVSTIIMSCKLCGYACVK